MFVEDAESSVSLLHEDLCCAAVLDVLVHCFAQYSGNAAGVKFKAITGYRGVLADLLYFDWTELHADPALRMEVFPLPARRRQPSRFGAMRH